MYIYYGCLVDFEIVNGLSVAVLNTTGKLVAVHINSQMFYNYFQLYISIFFTFWYIRCELGTIRVIHQSKSRNASTNFIIINILIYYKNLNVRDSEIVYFLASPRKVIVLKSSIFVRKRTKAFSPRLIEKVVYYL